MKEVGLYIHIPFCKSKCLYCDFNSYNIQDYDVSSYIAALISELEAYQSSKGYRYKTVFIGGGTPTFINCLHIGKIMETIEPYIAENAEVSMECNPGTVTFDSLKYYRSIGINRLSIGFQAWQEELLKRIGRIHTRDEFLECFNSAREAGFLNINVDLMFSLPGQSLEMWMETLESICKLSPEHISCYSLKLEEGTPMYESYSQGKLQITDEDVDRDMYHEAINYLKEYGYEQYEISNFAKPGYKCRHNLVYWKNQEYIGVGAGSHSKLENKRFWNFKSVDDYMLNIKKNKSAIEAWEDIGKDEDIWETVFLALRMNEGLDIIEFMQKYDVDFFGKFGAVIDSLKAKGLIDIQNEKMFLTEKGMDLSNQVFVEFM